jgi:hypothetical protein
MHSNDGNMWQPKCQLVTTLSTFHSMTLKLYNLDSNYRGQMWKNWKIWIFFFRFCINIEFRWQNRFKQNLHFQGVIKTFSICTVLQIQLCDSLFCRSLHSLKFFCNLTLNRHGINSNFKSLGKKWWKIGTRTNFFQTVKVQKYITHQKLNPLNLYVAYTGKITPMIKHSDNVPYQLSSMRLWQVWFLKNYIMLVITACHFMHFAAFDFNE